MLYTFVYNNVHLYFLLCYESYIFFSQVYNSFKADFYGLVICSRQKVKKSLLVGFVNNAVKVVAKMHGFYRVGRKYCEILDILQKAIIFVLNSK